MEKRQPNQPEEIYSLDKYKRHDNERESETLARRAGEPIENLVQPSKEVSGEGNGFERDRERCISATLDDSLHWPESLPNDEIVARSELERQKNRKMMAFWCAQKSAELMIRVMFSAMLNF